MKYSPSIERTKKRLADLRRKDAESIVRVAACSFCGAKRGARCQKNPPYGSVAPFPHVERRRAARLV